jgi:hypothetical protein
MILKKIKNSFDLKVVLILFLFLFLFSNSVITTSNLSVKLISLIIFSICCIPILFHYLDNNKVTIPLFHLSILFYGVMFSLPSFLSVEYLSKFYTVLYAKESIFNINQDIFFRNIFFVLVFLFFYFFGYFLVNSFFRKKFLFELQFLKKIKLNKILLLAFVFFFIKFFSFFFPILKSLPSINQTLIPLGYFSFAFFYFYLIKENSIFILKLLIIVCMFLIFFGEIISSNSLMYSLNCLMIIMIIYYIFKRKIPWLLLIFFIFIIIISPLKNILRNGNLYHYKINNIQQLKEVKESIDELNSNKVKESIDQLNSNTGAARALNTYFIYHFVLLKVPEKYPYIKESTYSHLLTSLIPRVLWKSKPSSEVGREFSIKYEFHPKGNTTSINLPWVAELYLNFSFFGLFFGMFLIGIFIAILTKLVSVPKNNYIQYISGLVVVAPLILPESNFALMVGGIIPQYIFLIIVFYIYLKIFK